MIKKIKHFGLLTFATLLISVGVHFFKFANDFTFGGITGLSILVAEISPIDASTFNLIASIILLIIGIIFLGKKVIIGTAYCSMLLSLSLSFFNWIFPMDQPFTDQPVLELCFAILLPALGAGILFNMGSSSGGTDILAMILKKKSTLDIGKALFAINCLISFSSFLVFSVETSLYSVLGLLVSALIIDTVIESINLRKYFNVVCSNPTPICNYITCELNRSATICDGKGAFSGNDKYIIFTVMTRSEAVKLRNYIKKEEPSAFILISNTSEIIGKGFPSV